MKRLLWVLVSTPRAVESDNNVSQEISSGRMASVARRPCWIGHSVTSGSTPVWPSVCGSAA
jgi:hypothetical protein